MRLYVNRYEIVSSNEVSPVYEMGMSRPAGALIGHRNFQVRCDLTPILDEGESSDGILNGLALWLNGVEINMVRARPNKPRCFFCGSINDSGNSKCPQCGGEIAYGTH